jgi:hypothetical protein
LLFILPEQLPEYHCGHHHDGKHHPYKHLATHPSGCLVHHKFPLVSSHCETFVITTFKACLFAAFAKASFDHPKQYWDAARINQTRSERDIFK